VTRFREDTPELQARAALAVAGWRDANPEGTPEEMLAAIGDDFDKDYGPLLRVLLAQCPVTVKAGVSIIAREVR
jgi:hypothetical protein